jgi:hypothetical protein
MTTTATTTTTTVTARSALHTRRLRRIAVAAGLTVAFTGTAALATNVLRDATKDHTQTIVVPAPYNGLPNLRELGVNTAPAATIVVPAPYNALPNLRQLGVTIPTSDAAAGR